MSSKKARLGACVVVLAALVVSPALSAPDDAIAGDWTLSGSDATGAYTGSARFTLGADGRYSAVLVYRYADGSTGRASFKGTRDKEWLTGERTRTPGITGALGGESARPEREVFRLAADGRTLTGTYARQRERLERPAARSVARAGLSVDGEITLVPNAPRTLHGWVHLDVTQGRVKVETRPSGVLSVATAGELGPGTYELPAVPVAEGRAEVCAVGTDGVVVASAPVVVVKERLYLLLFGCADVDFLAGDVKKVKAEVLPPLLAAGYTVIEDGVGYDQGKIDRLLDDPRSGPRKVVVDACTTERDFERYFDRGSIAGYTWHSHGAMEPFTGCPDSELLVLESRVFPCQEGRPDKLGERRFVRQFEAKLAKNAYPVLDFGLNHSCCTGGLGEYTKAAWEHCLPETRKRVEALFPVLPDASALKFRTFETLRSRFVFEQCFEGSAHSPMLDVNWEDLRRSIKPR